MGLSEWIEEKDQAIDKFLADKLGVAFSIFDAISPGTTRQVTEDPNMLGRKDSFLSKTFFPRKRYDHNQKYGWDALALRIFLGKNTHELFEMLDAPRKVAWYPIGLENKGDYSENLQHWNYAWRENYRCGHGDQAGLVNIAAIFNPFNLWRSIEKTFSYNGLRLIAHGKNLDEEQAREKILSYLAGGFLCAIGSILSAPRRLVEFVISPVKPLWDCWAYNIENKAIGKSTSGVGWAIATFFTALNIVLLFGIITALAIPLLTNAANKVVEALGVKAIINVIPDKVIIPFATEVTDLLHLDSANLSNGDLNPTVSTVAAATTAAMTIPGSMATSTPCINRFKHLHSRNLTKMGEKSASDLCPYPDYWATERTKLNM